MIHIAVQESDFDTGAEQAALAKDNAGAVVLFTGQVRDVADRPLSGLYLEHYPGMTEQSLYETAAQAAARWPLLHIRIIHRVGTLTLGEQIVLVGVSSAHRQAAFAACEYIMDQLKTQAPLWKKELYLDGSSHWVDAKNSDYQRADRWAADD